MQSYELYKKVLYFKGNQNGNDPTQATTSPSTNGNAPTAVTAPMGIVSTQVMSGARSEITVYLNCTSVAGSCTLDLDIQITPDDSSQVWYVADAFTQISAGAGGKQAKTPAAIGRWIRTRPELGGSGNINFGTDITFPLRGYTS